MIQILRRRGSTRVGGTLTCPRCNSAKLKFIKTVGFDRDVYECKVCHSRLTYITSPFKNNDVPLKDVKKRPNLLFGTKIPLVGSSKR